MDETWVRSLVERYELAERLRMSLGLGNWVDAWCRSKATGTVSSKEVDVDALSSLGDAGWRIEITFEIERLRFHALAEGSREFSIESSGEWSDAAPDEHAAAAARDGAARRDVAAVLGSLQATVVTLAITAAGRLPGIAWVRTPAAFVAEFEQTGWYGFASLLKPEGDVSIHVIVLDAENDIVRSAGLAVHGPDVWPELEVWSPPPDEWAEDDTRSSVPVPVALMPQDRRGDTLDEVAQTLIRLAGTLAWLRLADVADTEDGDVHVQFFGNKPVGGPLPCCPADAAHSSLELWTWATGAAEPGRRHAVSQAVSLQAEKPAQLFGRAASIRDTAEFLFSLSQSGLVQEALAARRASRDAAVAAGRSAADRARAAARAAVDRTLVVIGGAVGVLLANKGDLIDSSVALGLIALAATIFAGAALMAFHLELPGAARSVEVFGTELEHHAEVLSPRDIASIRALPSLADGNAEVQRARAATIAIVTVAFVALAGVAVSVVLGGDALGRPRTTTPTTSIAPTPSPTPTPNSTTTTAPPSPQTTGSVGMPESFAGCCHVTHE